jgi:serine protease DegS
MQIRKLIIFLFQSATVGLVAAVALLLLKPELFLSEPARVEVVERADTGAAVIRDGWKGPVSYADAVARAAPAVVNIYTAKLITQRAHPLANDPLFQFFFGDRFGTERQRLQTSLGSGVIISAQGYVLTNHHVVSGADQIQIMISDGRSLEASLVGADPETDLAVLKLSAKDIQDADLPSVVIGSSEQLRVGDVVLAIGNPFGVGQTVTQGIVSATGRNQLGISTFENFIQTDAAINPGNSGGALINAFGELVGINTAIFSRSGGSQGIGFAIPESLAKGVMKQIIEHGRVVRGWLGIEAQDLTPLLAESFGLATVQGVLITGVLRGGPAELAGLQPGDVVTALNDQQVLNARDSMNRIAEQPPGSTLRIQGLRAGKSLNAEARIGERPAPQPGSSLNGLK